MRSNAVSTQGKAGPLWVGHGAGPVPEPLTFSHKSLQSELPLNVVGRSGVWRSLWRGQSRPGHPCFDLFNRKLQPHLIPETLELAPE